MCGGRDFGRVPKDPTEEQIRLADAQVKKLILTLDGLLRDNWNLQICHGDSRGADRLAGVWARRRGVKCTEFPAHWEFSPRAAGIIRNQKMLREFKPHLVIAFSGGTGTTHMCRIAEEAGVVVRRVG